VDNTDPALRYVSAESPPCQFLTSQIQLTGSNLDRENGLNLNDRKSRNNCGSWTAHDPLNELRTCFLMVELGEGAGIEEISRHNLSPV
jgi:hypothetical protein